MRDVGEQMAKATLDLFQSMMGLHAEDGPLDDVPTDPDEMQLVALVGLSGSSAGVVGVYCSETLACRMAGALLGEAQSDVTAEVRDAFGEVANIIAGNVLNALDEAGEMVQLSLPTVIHGRSLVTSILNTVPPRRARRFHVGSDVLYVELAIRRGDD
jgi:chemotaxis protein CheX